MTQPAMPRPRLLFIDFAPLPGGSIQSLFLLLQHLPRNEFDPVVLLSPAVAALPATQALDLPIVAYDAGQGTMIPFGTATARLHDHRSSATLRDHRWFGSFWRWGSIGRRLWSRSRHTASFINALIERSNPDLVHLNDALPLAEPGILAAWRQRRPSVVLVRSFTPLDAFHRLISRLPAAGIFTSTALQRRSDAQGVAFRRELIVPNAVDLAQFGGAGFRVPGSEFRVRKEFDLPPEAQIVIVVGRIMQRKGLDVFIRAMAVARATMPQLHGLIIGSEDHTEPGLLAELRRTGSDVEHGRQNSFCRPTGRRPPSIASGRSALLCAYGAGTLWPYGDRGYGGGIARRGG